MSSTIESIGSLQGVLRLPNLNRTVRYLLEEWIAMIQQVSNPAPNHPPILTDEELMILDGYRYRFENDFSDSQHLEKNERDVQRFRSIRLFGSAKGFSLLFPWTLYIEARYGAAVQLFAQTVRNLAHFPSLRDLPQFIEFVARACYSHSVPLTRTAVRILRVLTNPPQSDTLYGRPTYEALAQAANCSERSVTNFMTLFLQRTVVSPRYLIDMGQLGFNCWQIEHTSDLPDELQGFVLRNFPLCPERMLSVLYLPNVFPIDEIAEFGEITALENYRINWNLGQLHWHSEERWREPVRLLGEYEGVIGMPRPAINFSFKGNSFPKRLTKTDFALLDQLQLIAPGTYDELALNLGLKKGYVAERVAFLVAKKLAFPYYNLNRINLTSVIAVKWGANGRWNEGLVDNLLAFPYAETFVGHQGGMAVLKVPPAWTSQILTDIMRLRNEGYDIWGLMAAPRIARWGLLLAELADKYDQFFEWQWRS